MEHYLPCGPAKSQKIREQAEQKYREIMESPNYLQNKQAFLTFMQTINTEIIAGSNSRVEKEMHVEKEFFYPEELSIPSKEALEKIQKMRMKFSPPVPDLSRDRNFLVEKNAVSENLNVSTLKRTAASSHKITTPVSVSDTIIGNEEDQATEKQNEAERRQEEEDSEDDAFESESGSDLDDFNDADDRNGIDKNADEKNTSNQISSNPVQPQADVSLKMNHFLGELLSPNPAKLPSPVSNIPNLEIPSFNTIPSLSLASIGGTSKQHLESEDSRPLNFHQEKFSSSNLAPSTFTVSGIPESLHVRFKNTKPSKKIVSSGYQSLTESIDLSGLSLKRIKELTKS